MKKQSSVLICLVVTDDQLRLLCDLRLESCGVMSCVEWSSSDLDNQDIGSIPHHNGYTLTLIYFLLDFQCAQCVLQTLVRSCFNWGYHTHAHTPSFIYKDRHTTGVKIEPREENYLLVFFGFYDLIGENFLCLSQNYRWRFFSFIWIEPS